MALWHRTFSYPHNYAIAKNSISRITAVKSLFAFAEATVCDECTGSRGQPVAFLIPGFLQSRAGEIRLSRSIVSFLSFSRRTFSGHISGDGITDAFVVARDRRRPRRRRASLLPRVVGRVVREGRRVRGTLDAVLAPQEAAGQPDAWSVVRATWCVRVSHQDKYTMPFRSRRHRADYWERPTGPCFMGASTPRPTLTTRPVLSGPVCSGARR